MKNHGNYRINLIVKTKNLPLEIEHDMIHYDFHSIQKLNTTLKQLFCNNFTSLFIIL